MSLFSILLHLVATPVFQAQSGIVQHEQWLLLEAMKIMILWMTSSPCVPRAVLLVLTEGTPTPIA